MHGRSHRSRCLVWLGICFASLASAQTVDSSAWRWKGVPRIIAVGDVHGSYDKLVRLLRGTGLVDEALAWSGGTDHLVLVGDMVDRGPDDRQVLDLVRRLQGEAQAVGGRVHTLLGNHEAMNLSGDLRYVSEKGFRDFLPEEDRKARNRALQRFRARFAPGIPLSEVKPAFEKRFPPGYFGRLRAFWFDGEYGSWLLEQPAVIMINGVVFVHGGLTDQVAALGLDAINRKVQESLRGFMENGEQLVQLTGAPPSYADALSLARELGQSRGSSTRNAVARTVLELSESLPYVPSGPLWYRGVSTENERLERDSVDEALAALAADVMVVGHTPTASRRINSRFDSKVFRVDVGMAYGREPLALVLEGNETKVYDPASDGYGPFVREPPLGEGVARFSEQLPEEQLERFLRQAPIEGCEMERRGLRYAEICDLEHDDLRLRAVFQTVDEGPGNVAEEPTSVPRTYRSEIASYLIDRLLEVHLVPVTVERTIDGKTGSLQLWLESAVDLPLLETYDMMEQLDGLESEIIRADRFMAFIDVYAAHETVGVMLLPQERRLQVADSTKAFSNRHELNPELLTPPCGPIEPDRLLFLRSITREDIESVAGRYLSADQIDALVARGGKILEACGETPGPTRSSE